MSYGHTAGWLPGEGVARQSTVEQYVGLGVQETRSCPPRSVLSLVTGAQHIKPRAEEGQGHWEYVQGSREQSLETSLCQKGVAHRALKHWPAGAGRGSPSPLNSLPVRQVPYLCGVRAGEERRTEASIRS